MAKLLKKSVPAGLSLCLALSAPSFAGALSLRDVVSAVLARNAALQKSQAQVDQAAGALGAARSGYSPALDLKSGLTHGDNPVYAFGSRLDQGRFEASDFALDRLNHPDSVTNLQAQARLRIDLLDGQRPSRVRAARSQADMARQGRESTLQALRFQAVQSFYALLESQEQEKILDQRIAESESELADALRLKQQGLVLGSDFLLGRAILGELKQRRVQAQAQTAAARSALLTLMEADAGGPLELNGSLDPPPDLKAAELAGLLESLGAHPVLKAADASSARAGAELDAEKRSAWPVLSGFGSVEGDGDHLDSGSWNYLSGVQVRMPLLDPGYRSRLTLRRAGLAQAQADRRLASEELALEVRNQYQKFASMQENLPLARQTAADAEEAVRIFRKLYRSGRQSIADVLRGELVLAQAQGALAQNLGGLRVEYARLLLVSGRLDDLPKEFQ